MIIASNARFVILAQHASKLHCWSNSCVDDVRKAVVRGYGCIARIKSFGKLLYPFSFCPIASHAHNAILPAAQVTHTLLTMLAWLGSGLSCPKAFCPFLFKIRAACIASSARVVILAT